jgi:hypothetical protein
MAFSVVVVIFIVGVAVISDTYYEWSFVIGLPIVVISFPSIITLGVMLVKHIRDIFKT